MLTFDSHSLRAAVRVLGCAVLVAVVACGKAAPPDATAGSAAAPAAVAPPAVRPQLPGPYQAVRLGMTKAEIDKLFPPREDVAACVVPLVGGDKPVPPEVPGTEGQPHARCARAWQVAGLTTEEAKHLLVAGGSVTGGDMTDKLEAVTLAAAEVRGSIRAGTVDEAAVVEAAKDHAPTAHEAVLHVAAALLDGMLTFVKPKSARRPIAAVISDDCGDLDVERVRTYVTGGYSLGELDGAARVRVANGKCRGQYVQHERELQLRFLRRAGVFGAIGLARASRPDRKLDPNDPATFAVYTTRTALDPKVARFGVRLANGLTETEAYWNGAVTLDAGSAAKPWGHAIAWLKDGRVVRLLLNFDDESKLGAFRTTLGELYGTPGTTAGAVTTWTLDGGITARLDLGAALAVVIDSAKASEVAPATTASPAASSPPK